MFLSSVLQKALAQRKVLRKGHQYCFFHQLRRLLLPFSIALNALSSSACNQLGYCQCVCWIFHYLLKLSAIIWNRLVELVVVFFSHPCQFLIWMAVIVSPVLINISGYKKTFLYLSFSSSVRSVILSSPIPAIRNVPAMMS